MGQISEIDLKAVRNLKSRPVETFREENPKTKLSMLSVINENTKPSSSSSPILPVHEQGSDTRDHSETSDSSVPKPRSDSNGVVRQRVFFKETLNKSAAERMDIFLKTQDQSDCSLWFAERRGRITGSVCGRVINRNSNIFPKSLIETVLKTSSIRTAAMVMGSEQEDRILVRYLQHKRENGQPDIAVQKAGFLIDKDYGWLGASPDAVVTEHSSTSRSKGCVEIKAAVSFFEKSVSEAVTSNKTFCLTTDADKAIQLKRNHAYFHQCQLQLFVGRDMFEWCDFVVATERDLFIERITLDRDWVSTNVQQLESFYDSFILPRLVL